MQVSRLARQVKTVIAIKRVIDPYARVRVDATGQVVTQGVKMVLNPFCANALEQALQWREQGKSTAVTVVSVGGEGVAETLRTALAMGADDGTWIRHDKAMEPLLVAKLLAAFVQRNGYDLVLFGKQAIDDDYNQTAQMTAAVLNWGQALFLSSVELVDGQAVCRCEVDAGIETVKVGLPCVLSADLRLNEPRYVSLPNLMKAKGKELLELPATELGVDLSPRITIQQLAEPPQSQSSAQRITPAELAALLRKEGLV